MARRHREPAASGRKVPLPTWQPLGATGQRAAVPQLKLLPLRPDPALAAASRTVAAGSRQGPSPEESPIPSPAPFLCQGLAVQRPASGALSPHLHGDAPALHGGEAVGQREARGANPVPGALHRVGLGEVGTHGGGWPAACGQASGTRPLPAPEPGPQGRAWQGASPAAQPTQGAGERREAGQEAVTGRERGESGSGNALLQTPPCWHGEPLRSVISLATRPAL